MTQETTEVPIWKKGLVYTMPGADALTVRQDIPFPASDGGGLSMDLYVPPASTSAGRPPALIIVAGYSDARVPKLFPCVFKEVQFVASWARLAAASGIAAITYANREPAGDLLALVDHVRKNGAALGIDENRVGLFAASGNVPVALSLLMKDAGDFLKCAALCSGYMLDLDGSTGVAQAADTWKFSNPCQGKSIDDVSKDIPLLVARAGQDQFQFLNDSIDRFVAKALAANLPLTLVNHARGPHAFDMFDDTDATRAIIKQILTFLQFHLGATVAV